MVTPEKLGPEVAQGYIDQIHDDATPSEKLQQLATEINGKIDQFSSADQNELAEALKHKLGTDNLRNYITEQKLNGLNSLLQRLEQAGETGAPGPAGEKGNTGETGARGTAGTPGNAGDAGPGIKNGVLSKIFGFNKSTTPVKSTNKVPKINTKKPTPKPKPSPAPSVALPKKQAKEPKDTNDSNIMSDMISKGQVIGSMTGAMIGNTVGGGTEVALSIVKREWEMLKDPNVNMLNKGIRVLGVTALGAGLVYLFRKIVRGGTNPKTGKSNSGFFGKLAKGIGLIALATWGLNKIRPWVDNQTSKEETNRKNAEDRIAAKKNGRGTINSNPAKVTAPEVKPVTPEAIPDESNLTPEQLKEFAKQLKPGTNLMNQSNKIKLNDEKVEFKITKRGLMLNGHIYEASTVKPPLWFGTETQILLPEIQKAIWTKEGIEITAHTPLDKTDGTKEIHNITTKIGFDRIPELFGKAKGGETFKLFYIIQDINFKKVKKPVVA